MKLLPRLSRVLPILGWAPLYSRDQLASDLTAAVIVTIMLIPQSLAYAMLAGLPPQVGLYASILPLVFYALFGTSRALAVGPVAVISLMTAAAVSRIAEPGTIGYVETATALAVLSGVFLIGMSALRLGFLANFLSHPVISGFITASGILIAVSQLGTIFGIKAGGHTLVEQLDGLVSQMGETNVPTLVIGALSVAFLYFVRLRLKSVLIALGMGKRLADVITKAGPVLAVTATTIAAAGLALEDKGVKIVGTVPVGLPGLQLPIPSLGLVAELGLAAALLSLIGFVESVSVAQTLAAKRRQRIDPNQELAALGAANIGSAMSGGYPVTGGFARSVVNYDAGAETPAAGAFTAVGIAVATLFLTPYLYFLPKATLAATIIVAVLSLVDFGAIRRTWIYSKGDFAAMAATILITLLSGVENGVAAGVVLSVVILLYRSSNPHTAIVGLVPGTEHFRNVNRHKVVTSPSLLTLRVDESLYFANARFLEDRIYDLVAANPALRHVVLMCPAINAIDASALESLEAINDRLKDSGVTFHLSEVKGPVMDRLKRSHFLGALTGKVYLSQYQAVLDLAPRMTKEDEALEEGAGI
ncbi:SulP family inorganic anion transporter [Gimibacter soli]|uniref:Sulfate permease n=1 Tax=Gimibacter soli TaxID=3024400 RepID=A0AAF0BN06_9PROT|nr:sulfate permease [Gimibacter soli]WCL55335.1 sulfate permease [Gimibacter soli]